MQRLRRLSLAALSPIRGRSLLGVTFAIVVGLLLLDALHQGAEPPEFATIGALLTVAAATAAALLAHVAARLGTDARAAWLAVALGVYGLAAVPIAILDPTKPEVGAARVLAHACVLVAFALVYCAPRVILRVGAPWLVLGALSITAAASYAGTLAPDLAGSVAVNPALRSGFSAAMLATGAGLLAGGARRRNPAFVHIGAGGILLGLAHLLAAADRTRLDPGELMIAGTRLLALALLALGALRLLRQVVHRLDDAAAAHQEELRRAALRLDRAAERDHELRNGLAGLAGAAGLLASARAGADAEQLGAAVASELDRLDLLLRHPTTSRPTPPQSYEVAPVVKAQVALRAATGMEIAVDVDTPCTALGCPNVLSQILANLLANCADHAGGIGVRVAVRPDGDHVVVDVVDEGPGLVPGTGEAVLEAGVRGLHSRGLGLGLHVCRRLLSDQGGVISIGARTDDRPGCRVTVVLPAGTAVQTRQAGTSLRA